MAKETNKFLEATLEGAEAVADYLTENEMVKSIPVVGTALKVITGTMDLRDKIFLAKIQRFIQEIESISNSDRLEFKESIMLDNDSMNSTGEAVLLTLDKLADLKKAELLGFYFSCFLGGVIDSIQFRRIANAIDAAFIDDLKEFLEHGLDELLSQKYFMEALSSSGITVLAAGKTYDDVGQIFYEPSSMGRQMYEEWQTYKQR